jgi:CBS domain-containing protein
MSQSVRDYMTDITNITMSFETSLKQIMLKMIQQNSRIIILVDKSGNLFGVITGTDIVKELVKEPKSSRLTLGIVKFLKIRAPVAVPEDTIMIEAIETLYDNSIHTLPVTERGTSKPIGMITQLNIVKWWLEQTAQSE